MFTNLHTHSYFSLSEGLSSPHEIVFAAKERKMEAIALTDHFWMSGAVEFNEACTELGIKPIFGLELDLLAPPEMPPLEHSKNIDQIVLLALDHEGWRSLCRLSSIALSDAAHPTGKALTLEQLSNNSGGLICLTGGIRGLVTRYIRRGAERTAGRYLENLKNIFSQQLYISLQFHTDDDQLWNARLAELAKRSNLLIAASHNSYYLSTEQSELQKVVTAVRLNKLHQKLTREDCAPENAHLLSVPEFKKRFEAYPEALIGTEEIKDRCSMCLPVGETHFPALSFPEGMSAIQVLKQKARKGVERIYPAAVDKVYKRLEHELNVIDRCGYAPLFLVMEDIVQFTKEQDIPISSRGSAASSLVAHSLGITTPDPIRLNLYFERFLNPARATPPDIDTDLCSRRRDEVINYVYNRYGIDKTAMVCTINRFRSRSALREVAKVYGLSPGQIKTLADKLPNRWYGPRSRGTKSDNPYEELEKIIASPTYKKIYEHARALIGNPRHLSIHPGGVVIAPEKINDIVPVQLASKGVTITQFDLHPIEKMGLVKIDLLGIRGLTVLNDVGRYTGDADGRVLDFLENIPDSDNSTSDLVQQGRTIGCFQIESPGMRATLKEIQARSIDDIMVALALYRPGPLSGGLKDAFVRRHKGEEAPKYLHTSMETLLKDTYGVILYQEQVLRIANELAGLSLSDADLLRRAMSHFDPGKQMVTLKEKFISGAAQKSAVPEDIADRVWEMMAAFAGYGFPKAHAASYAEISWRSAWCKTHFPAIFMAAVLANWGGYYSQRVYLMEARRLGLTIRPPLVNHAKREFSANFEGTEHVLYMGLNQIRDLTRRTQTRITRKRPFHSLQDFIAKVDPRQNEVVNIIKVGGFEGFGSIPTLLEGVNTSSWRKGQFSLFPATIEHDDWSIEEKVSAQEEILGISVIAHPLEIHREQIKNADAINTSDAITKVGKVIRVAGMRQFWRRSSTRKGETQYIMTVEDLDGMLNVLISTQVYRSFRNVLSGYGPYIVEGTIEIDQERSEPFMRADRIWKIV